MAPNPVALVTNVANDNSTAEEWTSVMSVPTPKMHRAWWCFAFEAADWLSFGSLRMPRVCRKRGKEFKEEQIESKPDRRSLVPTTIETISSSLSIYDPVLETPTSLSNSAAHDVDSITLTSNPAMVKREERSELCIIIDILSLGNNRLTQCQTENSTTTDATTTSTAAIVKRGAVRSTYCKIMDAFTLGHNPARSCNPDQQACPPPPEWCRPVDVMYTMLGSKNTLSKCQPCAQRPKKEAGTAEGKSKHSKRQEFNPLAMQEEYDPLKSIVVAAYADATGPHPHATQGQVVIQPTVSGGGTVHQHPTGLTVVTLALVGITVWFVLFLMVLIPWRIWQRKVYKKRMMKLRQREEQDVEDTYGDRFVLQAVHAVNTESELGKGLLDDWEATA